VGFLYFLREGGRKGRVRCRFPISGGRDGDVKYMSLHEFRRRNEHKTPSLPLSLLTPSLPPPFLRTCHAPSFARQGISHLCMCVHFIWFFLITIPPLYVYMDGTLPSWLSEPVVVLVLVWPRALAFRRRLGCNLESVLLACKPKLALCVGGGGGGGV